MAAKHKARMKWPFWLAIAVAGLVALATVLLLLVPPWSPPAEPFHGGTTPPTTATPTTVTTATTTVEETTTTATDTTALPTTTKAPKVELTITSHKQAVTITTEPLTTFTGTSDPRYPLLLNGKEVARDKTGAFSVERELTPGKNTFVFSHKGKEVTYTVNYSYVVMRSYTPSGDRRYNSGSSFSVVVSARVGSTVIATFRGKTITLKRTTAQQEEENAVKSDTFADYSGTFTLPDDNLTDLELGRITFKATYRGQTDTGRSGTIVCKKATSQVIGEVVAFTAETFDGDKNDDDSRPTNNYFPQGTVDYVVGHSYYGDKEYLLLRCGRRVYVEKELSPSTKTVAVTREYAGKLPGTNKLSLNGIRVTADATYLTFNTDWKAPFFLDLLPQKYTNPAMQDYTVSKVTCEYVEITFCYASSVSGKFTFDQNHPLFTEATVQKSGSNTVLRLYLRRTGGFYGWDAYYNDAGQLEFYFLHPAQVKTADNVYGADLTGVTVMLDVGHGYQSSGASGLDSDHPEGERNYYLATLIQRELESIGTTVVLNRTATGDLNADQRCQKLKAVKPDLCIAVHHDSNAASRPNGFGAFHSTLFSYAPAKYIYDATMAADIYDASAANNRNRLEWHYYFVARMSDCPVVLTENGFMSSPLDHQGIVSDYVNRQKAQAITTGIVRYFLSIRIPGYTPPTTATTTTVTKKPVTVVTETTTTTTTTTTEETATTTEESTTTTEETSSTTEADTTDPPTTGSGQASQTGFTIP